MEAKIYFFRKFIEDFTRIKLKEIFFNIHVKYATEKLCIVMCSSLPMGKKNVIERLGRGARPCALTDVRYVAQESD